MVYLSVKAESPFDGLPRKRGKEMRKRIAAVIAVLAVSLCGLAFAACSDDANKSYTVTYHANGGIFDSGNITYYEKVEDGKHARGDKTPSHSDSELIFIGWGTSADATTVVNLSSKPITKDTDFYAVWHDEVPPPTQYTVTFYNNYADAQHAVFETQYVDEGNKAQKPAANPTRLGYTFNEWHTSADNDVDSPYSFAASVMSDIRLYAHWTEDFQEPVITGIEIYSEPNKTEYVRGQAFNDEGLVVRALFSGDKQPEILVKGVDYTVSEPDMTALGVQTVTVTHTTETGTLTAKFEITVVEKVVSRLVLGGALTYTTQEVGATFDPAGLTFKAEYNDGSEVGLTAADISFTSTLLDENGKFNAEGTAEITAEYEGVASGTKLHVTVETPSVPKRDVIFHANITAYSPVNMPETQRVEVGKYITAPAVEPTIKGYTFGGWYIDEDCTDRWNFDTDVVSTADVNLYAEWTAITYSVTYRLNDGAATNPATYTVNAQGVFEDVSLSAATKEHNTFGGWYTGSAFPESGKVEKLSYAMLPEEGANITLYAKFTPEEYTLSFELGGSAQTYSATFKDGVSVPSGYAYGDSIVFPDAEQIIITPNVTGEAVEFNFLGWYLSGDESKTHIAAVSPSDYGDKTFVADIIQAATHTVTFDMNYAGSSPRYVKVVDGQKVEALNPAPVRKGYEFDGWFEDENYNVAFDFDETVTADKTAYAKWNAVEYTVVYEKLPDGSDNTNNAAVYSITDGNVALSAPAALPAGWKFIGWFTNSGCTDSASSITPADIERVIGKNITFYAKVSNKYTVEFDGNVADGEVSGVPESVTVTYNNAFIAPQGSPSRESFTFDGWYKEAACENAWDFSVDKVTEDITLYAKWIENPDSGVYVIGTVGGKTVNMQIADIADFKMTAVKNGDVVTSYTLDDVMLRVGDRFRIVNYEKKSGTVVGDVYSDYSYDSAVYPLSSLWMDESAEANHEFSIGVSEREYFMSAEEVASLKWNFNLALDHEMQICNLKILLQRDEMPIDATRLPNGEIWEWAPPVAQNAVFLYGNMTGYQVWMDEWSTNQNGKLYYTRRDNGDLVINNVKLYKYDDIGFLAEGNIPLFDKPYQGVGVPHYVVRSEGVSCLMFTGDTGYYNIVLTYQNKTYTAITFYETKPFDAKIKDGRVIYEGKNVTKDDLIVTYDGVEVSDYEIITGTVEDDRTYVDIVYPAGGALKILYYTAVADTAQSFEITTQPAKTEYFVGDTLDFGDIAIKVVFASGDEVTVDANNAEFMNKVSFALPQESAIAQRFIAAGDFDATVVFDGETFDNCKIAVKVLDKLTSITLTPPNKATYPQYTAADKALAALDKTGMTVTAHYNEGIEGATEKTVAVDLADCAVTADFSEVGVGAGVITVEYTENRIDKTATVNVDITAPTVISIAATVNGGAADTYFVGDSFSLGNITFTATYDNGDSKVLSASEFSVVPFASAGEAVAVSVTYTANDEIAISGLPSVRVVDKLTSITSTAPDGLHTANIFVVGDTVTTAGMAVTAFYNGDTQNGKAVVGYTTDIAGLDMSVAGEKTITVTYTENGITMTAAVNITVVEKAITALTVSGVPADQYLNANFNPTGLIFKAVYNNDETAEVSADDITFTSEEFSTGTAFGGFGDSVVVTATYDGKSCDVTVKVINSSRYTVVFHANINSYLPAGMPSQCEVEFNGTIDKPTDPTLKGFTFGGWYKDAACTAAWKFTGETDADKIKVATDIYAKWTANSYAVNFYQESGLVISGKAYTAVDNVFGTLDLMTVSPDEKAHYDFVGWYIEGALDTVLTELTYDSLPETGTTISLKPVYEIHSYTVTYVYGNGQENGTETVDYNGKATKPQDPTREHYTFGGWLNNGAAYDFDTAVTADIVLAAEWNALEYAVEYSATGLTDNAAFTHGNPASYDIDDGAVVLLPAAATENGKSFIKWTCGGETVTELSVALVAEGKITLVAVFDDAVTYTVTFDTDGGSAIAAQTVIEGEKATKPADPTKTGYTFAGWFKDGAAYDFDTAVTADITLTAQWNIKKFTVTFDSNGGSEVEPQENIPYNTAATKPADPTKTGGDFVGWFKDEECTSEWDFDLDTVKGDITLYAKWNVATYTVTFDLMYEGADAIAPQTVAHGGKVDEPQQPTRVDYEFYGWFKEATLKTMWAFDADTVTADTVLYAKWMALTNKFMLVNGTTQARMYDNTAHNTDTAVKEEYTLLGTELAAGDKLTFKTREDGVLNAIAFDFDAASKGVTYASNTLTTKSEGAFDIYLKLLKTGKWKVYATGGAMLDGDYFIAGSFNEWTADNADFKLDNKSGAITLDLAEGATFKVVHGSDWLGYHFDNTTTTRVKAGIDFVQADNQNNFQVKESAKYKLVFDGEYISITKVGEATAYAITVAAAANGSVTASKATAVAGETITLTVTPADGYKLDSLTYNDGTEHVITGVTFVMPAHAVTITATFVVGQSDPNADLPYTDVDTKNAGNDCWVVGQFGTVVPSFDWGKGYLTTWTSGNQWEITITLAVGDQIKFRRPFADNDSYSSDTVTQITENEVVKALGDYFAWEGGNIKIKKAGTYTFFIKARNNSNAGDIVSVYAVYAA